MRYRTIRLLLLAAVATHSGSALAAIDHELNADQSGIWARKYQADLEFAVIAAWMLGSAVGYWSAKRTIPLAVQILLGGLSIGFSKQF